MALSLCSLWSLAQVPPKNWHLLDHHADGVYGISVEKAYQELLKNRKPKKKVIVAIIDVGNDITHPALKGAIWKNKKEVEGNGIDDDRNGYIDDVHGWNFMGGCKVETYDCVREYVKFRAKFEMATDTMNAEVKHWISMKKQTEDFLTFRQGVFKRTEPAIVALSKLNSYWQKKLERDSIYIKDVAHLNLPAETDSSIILAHTKVLRKVLQTDSAKRSSVTLQEVVNAYQKVVDLYKGQYETALTMIEQRDASYFRRSSPGDDSYTNTDIHYGNADVSTAMPHGNGVAGIIAATRLKPDVKGIASWVEVMPIVVVSQKVIGEERDKDVANAIRYAVDNGARIINISIGKQSSPQKELVDASVRYAASKGVLIFAAAGNDGVSNDEIFNYPNRHYADGGLADNLFVVGATTSGAELVWKYSNYGKNEVDFFAPGDDIYSPAVAGTYNRDSGTSYAAPVAAGVAALIWNYYPTLSHRQVVQCIVQSVTSGDVLVTIPGTSTKTTFKVLSRAGGIINAFKALKVAASMH